MKALPLPETPEEMLVERNYIRDERLGMMGVHGNMNPTAEQLKAALEEAEEWCHDLQFEAWRRKQ